MAEGCYGNYDMNFPCVILKSTEPRETADRLGFIYASTQLPILLALDSSEISDRQSDDLYQVIASSQIPVVIFQTIRRLSLEQKRKDNNYYLESN